MTTKHILESRRLAHLDALARKPKIVQQPSAHDRRASYEEWLLQHRIKLLKIKEQMILEIQRGARRNRMSVEQYMPLYFAFKKMHNAK